MAEHDLDHSWLGPLFSFFFSCPFSCLLCSLPSHDFLLESFPHCRFSSDSLVLGLETQRKTETSPLRQKQDQCCSKSEGQPFPNAVRSFQVANSFKEFVVSEHREALQIAEERFTSYPTRNAIVSQRFEPCGFDEHTANCNHSGHPK
jgi:hypothetical protein